MDGDRGLSVLGAPDQWARCNHAETVIAPDAGVQLAWDEARRRGDHCGDDVEPVLAAPVGIAFDSWCRMYRSVPAQGGIEVRRPGETAPVDGAGPSGPWQFPVALAIDTDQRLHIAEAGEGDVAVFDLWKDRLLRRIPVRSDEHPARRPVDVTEDGCRTWVLLQEPAGIVSLEGRRGPFPGPALCPPVCGTALDAWRLVALVGWRLLVLWRGRAHRDAYIATTDGAIELEIDGATDLAVAPDATLVVARQPEQAFRRFRRGTSGWIELEPIAAPGYDGGGIGVSPNGLVVCSTAEGIGWAGGSAVRYRREGRVVTYRLDSGAYRTRWGRLFLDACIPRQCSVRVQFLSSDEDEVDDSIPWSPADRSGAIPRRLDLTPPLPSRAALDDLESLSVELYHRADGPEWPWASTAPGDRFGTYEAPVRAAPGRYLWIVLDLAGTSSRTPLVRELRVEHPGHRLLDDLPRAWTRDTGEADFLHRFLAPAEGMLHELDERVAALAVLLDPSATPEEALAWLASFTGTVLDRRWPVAARRILVAEAYQIFRRRGTLAALGRLIEIYLGYPVVIVEQWRLRGLGGVVVGGRSVRAPAAPREGDPAGPVLGTSTRAGGIIGNFVLGGRRPGEDGFRSNAHRFSVLVPADLAPEQVDVVQHIIAVHRPAHTAFELCELGFGMRVGRRLHVSLSSIVGGGAVWAPAVVGQVAMGGDGIIGIEASVASRQVSAS